ncbi:MAG: hypothetical protein LT080_15065 [Thiobacillus sp.]|nr:hypothetical protein [Thiobacillus sp.]
MPLLELAALLLRRDLNLPRWMISTSGVVFINAAIAQIDHDLLRHFARVLQHLSFAPCGASRLKPLLQCGFPCVPCLTFSTFASALAALYLMLTE